MANYNRYDSVANPTACRLGLVRFSFVNVFEPKQNEDGSSSYGVCVLIPKSNTEALKFFNSAISAAQKKGANEKWGGKVPANLKLPLRDGDVERPDDEAFKDCYFFNCKTKNRPGVAVKVGGQVTDALDDEDFYSGCWGAVSVNLYAFNTAGNKGIGVGLQNVIKIADGDKLSGSGTSAASDFGDLAD